MLASASEGDVFSPLGVPHRREDREHNNPGPDNTPLGAAGLLTVSYSYPWVASKCQLCDSWFATATLLTNHHSELHSHASLRFKCAKCPTSFPTFRGASVHHSKCRGPTSPGGFLCLACEPNRLFKSQRGLTLHKNANHAELRNQERLAAEVPPPPRQGPRSSGWTDEEDSTFIARYLEFYSTRAEGAPGYSLFVQQHLPTKTTKQIRDRKRVLDNYEYPQGFVGAPRTLPAAPARRLLIPGPDVGDGADTSDHDISSEGPGTPVPHSPEPWEPDAPLPTPVPQPGEGLTSADTDGSGCQQPTSPDQPPPTPPTAEVTPRATQIDEGMTDARDPPAAAAATPVPEPPPDLPAEEFGPLLPRDLLVTPPRPVVEPTHTAEFGPESPRLPDIAQRTAWEIALDAIKEIQPVCPVGARIVQLCEEDGDIQERLDQLVEDFQRAVLDSSPEERRPMAERGVRQSARSQRTRRRITVYARTQELFKKNPSRLAELTLQDNLGDLLRDEPRVDPPAEASTDLYKSLWETECAVTTGLVTAPLRPDENVPPITALELRTRARRLRPGTAPGLDGITRRAALGYQGFFGTLAVICNVALFRGLYPSPWKINRTTLIPKPGKDLSKAENWRPITIASIPARLFSGALERRLLDNTTINPRQRGFRPGNGCLVNCTVLDEVLRLGKRSSLVGVQLDVSKAFDTVSHAAIAETLRSHGVPACLQNIISQMYAGSSTILGNIGSTIHIRRGVKQGDPLSPLLFNLVLDPLLNRLQESADGFPIGDQHLAAIAYADDITLFSSTPGGMARMLDTTSEFLASVGMSLSVAKCGAFNVERLGEAWAARPINLSIYGTPVKNFGVEDRFTYLGASFTIQRGFDNRHHLGTLRQAAGRVRRLSLKPHQKVQLLMQYIVPAFSHRLTIDPPSGNDLQRVDTALRGEVKKILHLQDCTTDGLLYSRKRDGGLGFPQLGVQVKICALRAGLQLQSSADPLLAAIAASAGLERRLEALARGLHLDYPPTRMDIDRRKLQLKREVHNRWAAQPSQGAGAAWYKDDPVGNYWLLNQVALKPGQFIDALKMRTDTYGTRVAINRAARGGNVQCRRCPTARETLGHILGQCFAGDQLRNERHNCVVKLIEEEVKTLGAVTTAREQPFTLPGEGPPAGRLLKPDLVINTRDQSYVVDVTIRLEWRDSLQAAHLEKLQKYQQLLPTVQQTFGTTKGEVIPVVLGSLGSVPQFTITGLKKLGIVAKKTLVDMSLIALRTSIDMGRQHQLYVQRPP